MSPHSFSRRLLAWYRRHGRHDLPWQKRRTPYRVWVSEIMLQQTQVGTVIPYYRRFMARFPNLKSLATSDLDEVLHLWTGLGYYARARNLHRAARLIRSQHGGRFPKTLQEVQALPGIGRSTAGAILALSKGQRHPILDGNVKRVLTRFQGIEEWPGLPGIEARLWEIADSYTPANHVADYTQAIMDLGATLCTRIRPDCARCPMAGDCVARERDWQDRLPAAKQGKKIPEYSTHMLMLQDEQGRVLLQQRPPSGIWGGLWGFPEHDSQDHAALKHLCEKEFNCRLVTRRAWPERRHTFSHFRLRITPVHLRVRNAPSGVREPGNLFWYDSREPARRGLAAPVKQLLQQLQEETP